VALMAENAALREKLKLPPPKTPNNSSTPPSQGCKASSEAASKPAESGATRTPIPRQGGQHSGDCGQQVMAA